MQHIKILTKFGITPLVQAHYKEKDKNKIYKLLNNKKEDYTSFSAYTENALIHTNELLEKFSDCVYYKSSNGKLYKIYKNYFFGSVNYNKDTGLVDEVIFTCENNEKNYNDVYDQQKAELDL